jgi:hypothetical protein
LGGEVRGSRVIWPAGIQVHEVGLTDQTISMQYG